MRLIRPAGMVLCLALALTTGCSAAPTPGHRPPARAVPARDLDASVAQFRFDEGTPHLRAGVVNGGDRDIRVTRATISWPGLAFSTVRLPADVVHPGEASAFTIDHGRPRCGAPPSGRPVLVAVVDGRERRLPLHVDQPGLLDRLRADACSGVRLARQATVRLRLAAASRDRDGGGHLTGAVLLTRRSGSGAVVRVVDLGGSVLFDIRSRRLPAALRAGDDRLSVPLSVSSTGRCDGHARGQSQQTFLFEVYLRVGHAATQRVVTVPTPSEQTRLLAMLDRLCAS